MKLNKFVLFIIIIFFASCSTPFKQGKKSFDKAEYDKAIGHFKTALDKGGDKARVNYYLAESYRKSNRIQESEEYYKAALDANSNEDNARYYYGYALKANGKYEEAEERFNLYAKSGKNSKYIRQAREESKNLPKIKEILDTKTYFEVQNCDGLNTASAEFGSVPFRNKLLFSSTRKDGTYLGTGSGFSGIYAYDFTNLEKCSGSAEVFSKNIFLAGANEASPTFARNGSFIIFARSSTGKKGQSDEVNLYMSRKTEDGWSEAEILGYPVNISEKLYEQAGLEQLRGSRGDYWTACPMISPDGKRLYFASNRPGGYGGVDIWRANISSGGVISNVRNAGPQINTPGNELFPFVSNEGVLYFASDGHAGIGGLDIFEAIRKDRKTNIKNMGIPLNSKADDFGLVFTTDTSGYFTSNREGGKGNDDIYAFGDVTPQTKIVNYFLTIDVVGISLSDTNKVRKETPLADMKLDFYKGTEDDRGQKLHSFTTDKDGNIAKFPIKAPADYLMIAGDKEGETYLVEEVEYYASKVPHELLTKPVTDTTYRTKVTLRKIEKDIVEYGLQILYDFNEFFIRPDAAAELDKFIDFLNDNPKIRVRLGSHTDARGTDENNQILSENRAKAAVQYLIENGIDENRLEYKGYGEEELIYKNAQTEEEHQANRRTEFRIIK